MVTIDIEDNAINVVVVQGKNVKNAVHFPLEPDLVKDGVILNPDLVGEQLKEILAGNNIHEKDVIVSVSGIHSIYRLARLPKIGSDLMSEAVSHEMSRLIPVPLEEMYTSWQAIPVNNSENAVPMLGIPRETIDFTLSVLKQAELTPKYMDVRPLAIARLADEKDAIVINIQPFSFDIVLLIDGLPEIVRSLSFSESLVSPEEKVGEIKEELERTVNYYNNSKPAKPVDDNFIAFVSGEYKDLLSANIVYQDRPLRMPFNAPEGFDNDQYIVNTGLALKQGKSGVSSVRANLNVLPSSFLPKPVPVMRIVTWVFILLAVLVTVMMVFNWQRAVAQNSAIQNEIDSLTVQIEDTTANKTEAENFQAQLQAIAAKNEAVNAAVNGIHNTRDTVNAELGEIISLMPGEIIIHNISYGNGWTVTGSTTSYEIIINYAYALQNSSRFNSMKLGSIVNVSYNQWTFVITLNSVP